MSLTLDPTHASEARSRLCEQFKGNVGIEALINAHSEGIQLIEGATWTLQTKRLPIDSATGVQLDGIGDIVGRLRNALDDAHYLLWLKAQMLANASAGCPETLVRIVKLLVGTSNVVHLYNVYPAAVLIDITGVLPTVASDLMQILPTAVAGGVNLQFIYSMYDDAHTFTFSSGDTEEASTDQGWAPDDQSAGGYWADVQIET